ncbi:MAG TPA: UDP-glucuronosyltransferase, partial [Burkholderiales bacterium]|nr:UDP-glucuronosyltransferase [Burkholderiales bacterium]
MSRILYAWEIGSGYGHVASFLPVAVELRKRGHEVLLALRDVSNADAVLDGQDFLVFQAPVRLHPVNGLREPPLSYAEILFRFGYLSVSGLTGLVRTWRQLFDSLKVDMVVADHSPTALLAARGTTVRRVVFGNGFPSPPRVHPLPNMRAWWDVPRAQLVESERRVLEVVNRALAQLGGRPMEALHDLFAVDENFLCTFAELDHYQGREGAQYWGPVISMDEGDEAHWPAAHGRPRIFVYLRPHRNSESVLKILKTIDCEALVVAPGMSPRTVQRLETDTIRLSTCPVKITQVRRQ